MAEKTGYPPDMLDLDLDLEADLGIDTVKQAELFAAIREAYGIPRDEKLQAARLPDPRTTSIQLRARPARPDARSRRPRADAREPRAAAEPPAAAACAPSSLDAAERVPRRVPVAGAAAAARALQADRRRRSARAAASSSCPTRRRRPRRWSRRLEKRGVDGARSSRARRPPRRSRHASTSWLPRGPIQGVYWLPALDAEADARRAGPRRLARGAARAREAALHDACAPLDEAVARPGTLPRRGHPPRRPARLRRGRGADAPLGGAVTGFTKAYKRERPTRW